MIGERFVEARPRPALFVPATLTVTHAAAPPEHALAGEPYWWVRFSDGRERCMAERALRNPANYASA